MEPTLQKVIDKLQCCLPHNSQYRGKIQIEPISLIQRPFSTIMKAKLVCSNESQNIIIKIYKSEDIYISPYKNKESSKSPMQVIQGRVKKDAQVTQFLYNYFREYPNLSTAKIIAFYPELLTIVMKESPGQKLSHVIEKNARFYTKKQTLERLSVLCENCGRWLKICQRAVQDKGKSYDCVYGSDQQGTKAKLNFDKMIEYVDLRLKKLVNYSKAPFNEELRSQVLRYFEAQRKLISPSDLFTSGIHADFCPGNVLVNGNEVIVLDLAMFGWGSIYHDIARFYHQLELFLMKPIFRPSTIAKLQEALLKGYNQSLRPTNPMFQLLMIQHTACHFVTLLKIENPPFHEKLYNKRIMKKHAKWLAQTCRD